MMKKFSEYLKDFIIITVSITIAFWVENYRESRQDYNNTQALLSTIRAEMYAQEGYLQFLMDHANKHSLRFDSLVTDLKDGKIEKNQLLIDVAMAYLPYVADISESQGFESLKSSGLLSNIKNDTLITELFHLNSRMKRNLSEYNEAWKKSQDRLRNLLTEVYGPHVEYNFKKSKLLVITKEPIAISKELSQQIVFELIAWITIMKQYSIFVERNRDAIKELIPMLAKETQ